MSRLEPPSGPSMRHSASFEAFGNVSFDSGFIDHSVKSSGSSFDFDSEFNDDEFAAADFVATNVDPYYSGGSNQFRGGGFNVGSITINLPDDDDEEPGRSRSPTGSFIEYSKVEYELDPDSIGTSLDDFNDTEFTTLEEETVVPTGLVSNDELALIKSKQEEHKRNSVAMSKLIEGEAEESLTAAIERELSGKATSGDSVKQKKDKKPKASAAASGTTTAAAAPTTTTPVESKKKYEEPEEVDDSGKKKTKKKSEGEAAKPAKETPKETTKESKDPKETKEKKEAKEGAKEAKETKSKSREPASSGSDEKLEKEKKKTSRTTSGEKTEKKPEKDLTLDELQPKADKYGYLQNQIAPGKPWKKFYFILKGHNLYFFNDHATQSLTAVIKLSGCSVFPIHGDSAFKIVSHDMLQQFKAESYDEYRKWTKCLFVACVTPDNDFSTLKPHPMIYSENRFKEIVRPTGKPIETQILTIGVTKKPGTPLGMDIQVLEAEGALISKIMEGGAAFKSGKLKVGDLIVKIGDDAIKDWTTEKIIDKLKSLNGEVYFTVSRS